MISQDLKEKLEALQALQKQLEFETTQDDDDDGVETEITTTVTVRSLWNAYRPLLNKKALDNELGRWHHILPVFGDRDPVTITKLEILQYRAKRREEKAARGGYITPGAPFTSAATRNREVACLRHLLNWAVDKGLIPYNPIASIEMEEEVNTRNTILREDAMDALLAKCSKLMRAIILVAYDAGLRKAEVVKLQWSQVDWYEGVIDLGVQHTKTKEARRARLTARAFAALKAMPKNPRSPFVFFNPTTDHHYNVRTIYKYFVKAVKRAGLWGHGGEKIWVHDLRRSFATLAVRRGVPEQTVMEMSGWRTREVFDRYSIKQEGDVKAAVVKIEDGIARDREMLVRPERRRIPPAPPRPAKIIDMIETLKDGPDGNDRKPAKHSPRPERRRPKVAPRSPTR